MNRHGRFRDGRWMREFERIVAQCLPTELSGHDRIVVDGCHAWADVREKRGFETIGKLPGAGTGATKAVRLPGRLKTATPAPAGATCYERKADLATGPATAVSGQYDRHVSSFATTACRTSS
jgi:hypothetical protein